MLHILYFPTISDSWCFVYIHIWLVGSFRKQSPSSQSSLRQTQLLHQAHNCMTLISLILSVYINSSYSVWWRALPWCVCTNWDVNKLWPKNLNLLRVNVLISATQGGGNSRYWFWTFQFHTEESLSAHRVQSNMVAFDLSSQLHGGWAMAHRKNKHYPLWPSWPSAAWVNGTSSCFWAPPDKLTLW